MAIVEQQYHGDVTIHPKMQLKDYFTLLGNPSLQEYRDYFLSGERATCPKIAKIRDQTIIGQTLEDCIMRLKKQRSRRANADQAPAPNSAVASIRRATAA